VTGFSHFVTAPSGKLRHTLRVLTLHVTPVESLLFSSDVAAVGSFRCPASHPLFRDSGPIGNPLFVFPRTIVEIRHDGGGSFVSDPNMIPLYNRNQVYSRGRVSDADASDWYAIADDILLDAMAAYDPYVHDRPAHPFPLTHVTASSALYFEQRQLFESLSVNTDPLRVEEAVVGLLDHVLRLIYGRARAESPNRAMRERVEAARLAIASDVSRNISLRALAKRADSSPFALCRAFHAVVGMTVTDYRQSLRLRLALERLRGHEDLTTIALDLGYSSHSHFTMAFRREYGMTPSSYRTRSFAPLPAI
jgi:AraC family transcriptional regulator